MSVHTNSTTVLPFFFRNKEGKLSTPYYSLISVVWHKNLSAGSSHTRLLSSLLKHCSKASRRTWKLDTPWRVSSSHGLINIDNYKTIKEIQLSCKRYHREHWKWFSPMKKKTRKKKKKKGRKEKNNTTEIILPCCEITEFCWTAYCFPQGTEFAEMCQAQPGIGW